MAALVWFRRDLRLHDHAALAAALAAHEQVYCAFVFDTEILDSLPRRDRRVAFIRQCLEELEVGLRRRGGALIVCHGRAREEIPALARRLGVAAVHANRDYEPAAIDRDAEVSRRLAGLGCAFLDHKDQVIFERGEVLNRSGRPFAVFTPYKNAWLQQFHRSLAEPWPVTESLAKLAAPDFPCAVPSLVSLGFEQADPGLPAGSSGAAALLEDFLGRIDRYAEARDYPAIKGPSYLSVHLRFGTVSIRELVRQAVDRGGRGAVTWLGELIWREFYQMLLWHHPRLVSACFKPEFDALVWDQDEGLWQAWCEGRTGYPLVDAAMRQLLQSGYMHNRLRMVAAAFLCKDLGLDWRRGEAWFAEQLNDFDLAANNGGWQWSASTGCDAQPWFRIFNPVTQSEKFDAQGRFIRRYLPELARVPDRYIHAPWRLPPADQEAIGVIIGRDYPWPVVDHAAARQRTLDRYGRLRSRPEATDDSAVNVAGD
jgi:deoxyribodipyrimidine photo-lyase